MNHNNKTITTVVLVLISIVFSGCTVNPHSNRAALFSDSSSNSPMSSQAVSGVPQLGTSTEPEVQAVNDSEQVYEQTGVSVDLPGSAELHTAQSVAQAALSVSDARSFAKGVVEEKRQALEVLSFEKRPKFVSSGRIQKARSSESSDAEEQDSSGARIGLQQSLYDFGRHSHRYEQANTELSIAEVEYLVEQNQSVSDALTAYANLLKQQAMIERADSHIDKHQRLRSQIKQRVRGGVADLAELSLIDIRLQELSLERESDIQALGLMQAEFEFATRLKINSHSTEMSDFTLGSMDLSTSEQAPSVLLISEQLMLAKGNWKEVKSSRFPPLMLEVFANTFDEDSYGIGLSFDSSDIPGFSYKAQVGAARLAVTSAEAALKAAVAKYELEYQKREYERESLQLRQASLQAQVLQTSTAVDLFFEQLKVGSRSITDAISIYKSALTIDRQLIQTQSEILINRIETANLLGALNRVAS